jgi:probable HAF family extracellular repeat protein
VREDVSIGARRSALRADHDPPRINCFTEPSEVLGSPTNDATGGHGFLDTGGVFIPIDVPGSSFTQANGINATAQIVGLFRDGTGTHGFLDTGGVFITIDVPDSSFNSFTDASGINATGQIVGTFTDNALRTRGFLDTGGVFTPIDVPGASLTVASGINDAGQIVGAFRDATGLHGFPATPTAVPAPSTLQLLGTGLAFGVAWKRIRRRSGPDT